MYLGVVDLSQEGRDGKMSDAGTEPRMFLMARSEQRLYSVRLRNRRAVDQHDVTPSSERRALGRDHYGFIDCRFVGHDGRRCDNASPVRLGNCSVYTRRHPKIIGIYDEAAHEIPV